MRLPTNALARTALLVLLGACSSVPAAPGPDIAQDAVPRATALRLSITGRAGTLAELGAAIPVELQRAGGEPVVLEVPGRDLALHDLPPGRYRIAAIGPLACDGLEFELAPGAAAAALGTLRAQVLRTDYDVAVMSHVPADATDLARIGGGAEPVAMRLGRDPLCHAPRDFQGPVWAELPLEQKLMFGLLMAGFCAATVASGNICAF